MKRIVLFLSIMSILLLCTSVNAAYVNMIYNNTFQDGDDWTDANNICTGAQTVDGFTGLEITPSGASQKCYKNFTIISSGIVVTEFVWYAKTLSATSGTGTLGTSDIITFTKEQGLVLQSNRYKIDTNAHNYAGEIVAGRQYAVKMVQDYNINRGLIYINATLEHNATNARDTVSFGFDTGSSTDSRYMIRDLLVCNVTSIADTCAQQDTAFKITAIDLYNSSAITTFNATIPGVGFFSTTNGTIVTNITKSNGTIYNITTQAADYFSYTESNYNTSKNLEASMYQVIVNIRAINELSDENITTFSSEVGTSSNTTTTGLARHYVNAATHAWNVTVPFYDMYSASTAFAAQTEYNITVNLTRPVLFTILEERTLEPFDVGSTNRTLLTIYCGNRTYEYEFNVSANNNTLTGKICEWEYLKLDIIYNDASYFRTLIPDHTAENITFIAVDLNEDTVYQIIIKMNDLTGEYTDGSGHITKPIYNQTYDIIQQDFNAENKIVTYLLKDGMYTLTIQTADGTVERNIGYLAADLAGTKSINVPDIEFTPDHSLGDAIAWDWQGNSSQIRFVYTDSDTSTASLYFYIYNLSNTSQIFYSTTSTDLGTATYTYVGQRNQSYGACFNATLPSRSLYDCHVYLGEGDSSFLGDWPITDDTKPGSKNNIVRIIYFILVVIILGGVGIYTPSGALFTLSVLTFAFMAMGWLRLINPYVDWVIFSLLVIITILSFIAEGGKK